MKKKTSFTSLLAMALLFILLPSCKKDNLQDVNQEPNKNSETLGYEKTIAAKQKFAIILSKAVSDNAQLRSFIQNEALKKVDNDYDVFYHFVKQNEVSQGKTLREILLQYESKSGELAEVENILPLLTIFVPTLPNGFNPKNWVSSIEVPSVTSNFIEKDNTFPIYNNGVKVTSLKANEIPGFPTLVIKENERLKLKQNVLLKSANSELNSSSFEFIDEAFNGLAKTKGSIVVPSELNPDPILKEAYNTFGLSNTEWQRDYIYYGLTKTIDKGALNLRMVETIRMLKFSKMALDKMSDQSGDPTLVGGNWMGAINRKLIQKGAWSDGKFEIRIDPIINNTRGLSTGLTKYISMDPDELFFIQYQIVNSGSVRYVRYVMDQITPLEYYCNIKLITWDLQTNSYSWKFLVSEVDDQETYTTTETVTSDFATNFGLNLKIGLSFGSSSKETRTNTSTLVRQKNSDDLGTLELNFSSPVYLDPTGGRNSRDQLYTISNPMVEMLVIPTKDF